MASKMKRCDYCGGKMELKGGRVPSLETTLLRDFDMKKYHRYECIKCGFTRIPTGGRFQER